MKIIYIHQYFKTFAEGGSSRSYYLAKALVEQGCQVELITGYSEKQYHKKDIDGITVHYLPVFYDNTLGFLGRIWAFLKFALKAYRLAASITQADICYATSTPLTVGMIALALKWLKGVPFYFEVRDLWPLAPIQMGVIRNKLLKKFLYLLEKAIYKEAEQIVALSPGMATYIAKLTDASKINIIPNIADTDFFGSFDKKPVTIIKSFPRKFTITYFGAVGKVNQLEYLIKAARYFQDKNINEVFFQVIGKGQEWENIQDLAFEYKLANIQFIPHLNKYKLREVLKDSQAVYVSFALKPVLETSSPNKFFDSLAAGKLCIVNTEGWIKEMIEEKGCGFYADPNNPRELLKKLLPYLADGQLMEAAQASARSLAHTDFSRCSLTGQFVRLFIPEKVVHPTAQPRISTVDN